VVGVIGRDTGEVRLEVVEAADAATLEDVVHAATRQGATLYTDEWAGYDGVDRERQSCRHTPGSREWARDADGDGVREVHNNTCEGLWTGLRNFLRPFRGVSKWHLWGYVAVFQWAANAKRVTAAFVQALFGIRPSTVYGP
jgi:transposase-like protein